MTSQLGSTQTSCHDEQGPLKSKFKPPLQEHDLNNLKKIFTDTLDIIPSFDIANKKFLLMGALKGTIK